MLPFPVLALVVKEAVEVLDRGVVKFACLLNQQQFLPGHVFWLFAEVLYNDSLVPAKDIYCQVVLSFDLGDLRDGRVGCDFSDFWGTILVSLVDVVAADMP